MGLSLKKFTIFPKRKLLADEIQLRFLKRLSRLLENGYPLIEALEIIQWDQKLAPLSEQIINLLKSGDTIDQAFDKTKFHPDITSYLFFVRANGDLDASIQKCAVIYEQRSNYLKKFKQTMRYPLILLSIFLILLLFLRHTVLPSFIDIFQMSDESSSTILFSIYIIEWIYKLLLSTIALLFAGSMLWKFIRKQLSMEEKIKVYNLIPVYRQYLKLKTSFLFATHMITLIKTGMPIKEILTILGKQEKLPILSYYTQQMSDELSKGVYITSLLSHLTFIDSQLASIFQKNVDSDSLEKDLTIYADYITEELHRKMLKIIAMVQPIFFMILAGFIIFIYVTLMWPMFQLIRTI